jgi:hypothetical protein
MASDGLTREQVEKIIQAMDAEQAVIGYLGSSGYSRGKHEGINFAKRLLLASLPQPEPKESK